MQKNRNATELFKVQFLKSHNLIEKLIQQVLRNGQICMWAKYMAVVYNRNHYFCLGPKLKPKMTILLGHYSELGTVYSAHGMETSRGQWILLDTFFQNGQILVDILWEWIFMDIFWVNSGGHV